MAICDRSGNDPLLKDLVSKGINIVLPPREGLKAGDLIVAEKSGAARVGDWASIVGVAPKVLAETLPTFKSLSFTSSDGIEAGVGAQILGKALAFAGLAEGGLSGTLKAANAKQLDFQLTAPAVSTLTNLDAVLDELRKADAKLRSGYEDRSIYIVEKAWRARGISIGFLGSSGAHIDITAEMENQLKGAVQLDVTRRGDGRLTFIAATALIFGVTLRQIVTDGDVLSDKSVTRYLSFRKQPEEAYPVLSNELFVDLGS